MNDVPAGENGTVRLATWNVWGLRGGPRRVTAVLRSLDADVVCLQECPRWPGGRSLLRGLARCAGLRLVAGGGRHGVAVLVRPGIAVADSGTAMRPRVRRGVRWSYPRGVAWARVVWHGTDAVVASVHLDTDPARRIEHTRRITAWARAQDRLALAGDLNEHPDGATWAVLGDVLTDVLPDGSPTYPVGRGRPPRWRIDAVLVRGLDGGASPAMRAGGSAVAVTAARRPFATTARRPVSDHLPVVVDLTRAPPSSPGLLG